MSCSTSFVFHTIGVNVSNDGSKHSVVYTVAHDDKDGPNHGGRDAAFLVVIEAVKHLPQHWGWTKLNHFPSQWGVLSGKSTYWPIDPYQDHPKLKGANIE